MKAKLFILIIIFLLLAGGWWFFFGKGGRTKVSEVPLPLPSPTQVSSPDGFGSLFKKISSAKTKGWNLYKVKLSLPGYPVSYSIKYPRELIIQKGSGSGVVGPLRHVVTFTPRNIEEHLPIFKISLYSKPFEEFLSEGEYLNVQEIEVDGVKAKKKVETDPEGHEVRIVYIPLPFGNYTFLLQGNVFPSDKVGIDCDKVIDEMIKSFKIENL